MAKKYLFIAEKPSLMREVRNCYFNHKDEIIRHIGYMDFIALSGHVCTNFEPTDYPQWKGLKWAEVDYPMIPKTWGIKTINDKGKIKTIKEIKSKINDYDGVVVGTDSDVEGYGIYYLLEHYLHIEKMDALRFIEHSLTDKEILKSLLNMTDYHKDPTHTRFTESFILRSRTDWLYGINITRLISIKQNETMTVGRVKAPVIKLVYDNSMAIENFKESTYYICIANYGSFKAYLIDEKGQNKKFEKKDSVPVFPNKGSVVKKVSKLEYKHAPLLYDLPAIQSEAGKSYGYSPDEVLDIIQSLYEKHKVISYPRTQCRFVSEEKAKEFPDMLKVISVFDDLEGYVKQISEKDIQRVFSDKKVVNNKEVLKESHDALLPTQNTPNLSAMSEDEIRICHMIYKRLLSQFLPLLTENKTQIIIKHGNGNFLARGKIVVEQGWRKLYGKLEDNVIPNVNEGDVVEAEEFINQEMKTKPPTRLTDSSLIDAMANIASKIQNKELRQSLANSKGIGTPATRDTIIKDVIERGFISIKKKGKLRYLYITDKGKQYINSLSDLTITSPIFAALIDMEMKKVQRGEKSFNDAYGLILQQLNKMCKKIEGMEQAQPKVTVNTNCFCPKCGNELMLSKYYYTCNCGLKLRNNICGVQISVEMLNKMIQRQSIGKYTFTKKDGSTFDANLKLDKKDDTYDITFDFASGIKCPICGKENITFNKGGIFCDCGFKLFRKQFKNSLTDNQLENLISGKSISSKKFVKKNGDKFEATIKLNNDGKIEFVNN